MTDGLNEIERQMLADEAELKKLMDGGDEGEPVEQEEVAEEPIEEEVKEEPEEPAVEPAEPAEEVKDEALSPSAAAFAKERREKRELAAQKAALEAKLSDALRRAESASQSPVRQEEKKSDAKPEVINEEPNKLENYEEWLEWKDQQSEKLAREALAAANEVRAWRDEQRQQSEYSTMVSSAVEEFVAIENEYRAKNQEYGDAIEYGRQRYGDALKLLNPALSSAQIEKQIDQQMLMFAAQAKGKGLNPAEELFSMAVERFGYTPSEKTPSKAEAPAVQSVSRPKLSVVQSNKRRSATGLSGGGQGGSASLTAVDLENMTNAEFSKLSPSQLRELEMAS